jgi:hypothetical protein
MMNLTRVGKIVGIIAGILSITAVLFGALKSYAATYIDATFGERLGRLEQKIDDITKRLDDNGLKTNEKR